MKTFKVGKINGLGNVKNVATVEAEFFEVMGKNDGYAQYTDSVKFYVVNRKFFGANTKEAVAFVSFKKGDAFLVQEQEQEPTYGEQI